MPNKLWRRLSGDDGYQRSFGMRKINPRGSGFLTLKEDMARHGLELVADTGLQHYWVWRGGNSIPGETQDGFMTLAGARSWWIQYKAKNKL